MAALVASKVYYNLGEYDASMKYALVADDKFDLNSRSEYMETIVSKCISKYIELSQQLHDLPQKEIDQLPKEEQTIDPQLTNISERMLQRCVDNKEFNLAMGVALEARRLDVVEKLIDEYRNQPGNVNVMDLINYAMESAVTVVGHREFRNKVLKSLTGIVVNMQDRDNFSLAKMIVQLNDSEMAVRLFKDLYNSEKKIIAYQVAFDLVASAPQELLDNVISELGKEEENDIINKILKILSGVPTCDYHLTFLKRHNNTDLQILDKTKDQLEGRSSIFHNAVTFENAFLHAGTTADGFFRANLEWLSKAQNWTKFTATAALGVIHQGNLSQGYRILQPYLPEIQGGSCYTQGGSLYGLGIIFAGHGREVVDYLRKHVTDTGANVQGSESEVILHGAALGVGVAGMGSGSLDVYNELKEVLYSDSAIAGEGTGLAMGLVMVGSKHEEAEKEMLQYAHDTKHEKIIRSLAMGVALVNYAKEEAADETIEQLIKEQDPILRYGGAYTIALAYAGTGSNKAIQKLLHIAVSDASDDVRRAAVIGLGFILLRNHKAVPRMVELLSESHNPHVRYGTAIALGISCAATGLKEACDVLNPMLEDPVDFVRQGAMISLAMIMIQQNERMSPKVKSLREHFAKVVSMKHEDAMAKFGAALAQGIIDAGGRNVTISLEHGSTGVLNMKAVVGLAIFTQFWYWFPLTHFLSLSFTPTTIIGVREDLKIPKIQIDCFANLKKFEYPPKLAEKVDKGPEKLTTAVLSTTKRAKKTEAAKKKKKEEKEGVKEEDNKEEEEKMDVDEDGVGEREEHEHEQEHEQEEAEKEKEAAHGKVENMSRVLPQQLRFIRLPSGEDRFVPVRPLRGDGGVVVLVDKDPKAKFHFIKTVRQKLSPDDVGEEDEAPLPEPFTYDPPRLMDD